MPKHINDFNPISDFTNRIFVIGNKILNKFEAFTLQSLIDIFTGFFYTKSEVDNRVASSFAETADSLTFDPGTPLSNLIYRASAGPGIYTKFKVLKTGTITTTTGSTAIVGVGSKFLTQLAAGMPLYNSSGTLIGTVTGTPADDTHATLAANAAVAVTGGTFNGPVLVSSGDGQVDLIFNTVTGFFKKSSVPFPAFQKTITSITSPVPDSIGQVAVDSSGRLYIAVALTGTEMWRKLVRPADAAYMLEPWFGSVLAVKKTAANTINFTGGASCYLLGNLTIQLEVVKAGTVTAATNSKIVTGVGTAMLTDVAVGGNVYAGATLLGVAESIQSDTQVTLVANSLAAVAGSAYSTDYIFTFSGASKILCIDTSKLWVGNSAYRKYSVGGPNNCLVEKDGQTITDPTFISIAGYYNSEIIGYALGEYLRTTAMSDMRIYNDMAFEPYSGGVKGIEFPLTPVISPAIVFTGATYLLNKPNGHHAGLWSDSFPVAFTFNDNNQMLVFDTTKTPVIDGVAAGYDKHYLDGANAAVYIINYNQFDVKKHVLLHAAYLTGDTETNMIGGAGIIGRYYTAVKLKERANFDRLTFSPMSAGVSNVSFPDSRTINIVGNCYLYGKNGKKIIQFDSTSFPKTYQFSATGSEVLVFNRYSPFTPNLPTADYDRYFLDTAMTGTITTATNSKTVTGVGTDFLSKHKLGTRLFDSTGAVFIGIVLSVQSDTSLTLLANALSALTGAAYTVLPAVYILPQESYNSDVHELLARTYKGVLQPTGLMGMYYLSQNSNTPYRVNADKIISAALLYTGTATNKTTCGFTLGNDFHVNITDVLRTANLTDFLSFSDEIKAKVKATAGPTGATITDVVDFAMLNGDMIDGLESTRANALLQYAAVTTAINKVSIPVLKSIGNHDDNSFINLFAQVLTKSDQRTNLIDTIASRNPSLNLQIASYTNACAYYFDIPSKEIRIIVLDCLDIPYVANGTALKYSGLRQYAYSNAQLNWLAATALDFTAKTTPANWQPVVFTHAPVRDTTVGGFMHPTSIVPRIVNAFKAGGTVNETFVDSVNGGDFSYSVTKNFSSQGAMKFIGYFSGHMHEDAILADTEFADQTNVVVNNAWCLRDYEPQNNVYLDSGVNRAAGTVTQNSFDYVVIDKEARKVRLLRFGAGVICSDEPVNLLTRSFTY